MPNNTNGQTSNEDHGLIRYVNPADPTGPMLNTLAEVEEIKETMPKAEHKPERRKRATSSTRAPETNGKKFVHRRRKKN